LNENSEIVLGFNLVFNLILSFWFDFGKKKNLLGLLKLIA